MAALQGCPSLFPLQLQPWRCTNLLGSTQSFVPVLGPLLAEESGCLHTSARSFSARHRLRLCHLLGHRARRVYLPRCFSMHTRHFIAGVPLAQLLALFWLAVCSFQAAWRLYFCRESWTHPGRKGHQVQPELLSAISEPCPLVPRPCTS